MVSISTLLPACLQPFGLSLSKPLVMPLRDAHRRERSRALLPMRSEAYLVFSSPFGRAEQHRALRERAQRASTTNFGRLCERSGRRPRSEFCPTRKDRAAQGSPRSARAESAGVASLPPFLSIQERGSAAGPNSRRGLTQCTRPPKKRTRLRYLSPNGSWCATILDSRLRGNDDSGIGAPRGFPPSRE
jgi:hypothetical protein